MAERTINYPVVRLRVELSPSEELNDLLSNLYEEGGEYSKFYAARQNVVPQIYYDDYQKEIWNARNRLVRVEGRLSRAALVLAGPMRGRPSREGHTLIFHTKPSKEMPRITDILADLPTSLPDYDHGDSRVVVELPDAGLKKDTAALLEARNALIATLNDPNEADTLTLSLPRLQEEYLPGFRFDPRYL